MNKYSAIIIGGSGQYGITIGNLLIKQKYKVYISSRSIRKIQILKKNFPKINFFKLNIYKKKDIEILLNKKKPNLIFYFAGQSSPQLSFKRPLETLRSNVIGCKNILEIIDKNKINCKFINASSSEMYGHIKKKINLNTPKKPLNPYGKSKKISFELVKKYRDKKKLKAFNLILFNTESFLRNKNFIIPKICRAAINAFKYKKKTTINNMLVSREWNWCDEQCYYILKLIKKAPQDLIISNGKNYSLRKMIKFAFDYFKLDYKKFIKVKFDYLTKYEVSNKSSDYLYSFKKNNLKRHNKIFGKKLVIKMIKHYLNEK
tara:strand:- start:37 stop:987 length:951 start_codon:yes stop_codon:yes gene_type:complete